MKYLKRVILIISIVVLCLITSWFILRKYYLNELVHSSIEENLCNYIENDFHFSFDKVNINLISSKVKFSGLNLYFFNYADTVGYFKGDMSIHIQGWRNMLFDEQIVIKSIGLKEVDAYYAQNYPLKINNKNEENEQELEIFNVSAAGKLHYAEHHKQQNGKVTSNFNINISLNYDSKQEFNVANLVSAINQFEVTDFHYFLPDGFYQIQITELGFSEFSNINLKQVVVNPVDSKKAFALKKKVATDFISFSADSIQLKGFDNQIDRRIYIDQIQMFQPNFDVFKDKNFPEDLEYTAILVDLLKDIEIPIYIRTTEVQSMYIKYSELADQAQEAGDLFFSDANAKISNITNVKDSLKISGNMLIEAEAKFFGVGMLKTTMRYKIISTSGQFDIRGSLGSMDILEVNSIVSKLVPVKVKSGQLDDLRFNFSGTRTHSEGEMWFEYSDLNIKVLESDFLNSSFTREIISGLGNIVIKNSNPSSNGVLRVGKISQDRIVHKSMFNYWWISLQSGFLSSVGVKAKKEKINNKTGETATLKDKLGLGEK